VFCDGDGAILVDRRERRYSISLSRSKTFHTHVGTVSHDNIIGKPHGSRIYTSTDHQLLAFSPTLVDFVMEMPHATQVIYPKDTGYILMYGDIFPGANVVEAGFGSGVLTLALLRAVGREGKVTSYEIKPDVIYKSLKSLDTMPDFQENLIVKEGNIYEGILETEVDRLILDVPEPWHVVPHAANSLVSGGILISFLPTIMQVHQLHLRLKENPRFELAETAEVSMRPWSISTQSIRPVHRMVAHTGFITTARLCDPIVEST
jgi:tRNA (adenine57-N1/adenine58-N1)-methyltransferase